MLHHRMRRAVAGAGGGGVSYTATAVVLDCADNHGFVGVIGLRRVTFYLAGSLIYIVNPADFVTTQTSELPANQGQFAFDQSLSLTGGSNNTTWATNVSDINQRVMVNFNGTNKEFDRIDIDNWHNSGANPNAGVNNCVITRTDFDYSSPTYGAAVTDGEVIFNGAFREHVALDQADPETLDIGL